jgi:hypothetical protein
MLEDEITVNHRNEDDEHPQREKESRPFARRLESVSRHLAILKFQLKTITSQDAGSAVA